jgi:hypothetical protein
MIFNDSEPLRQEHQKIGQTYEQTEFDKHYEFVLKQIEGDPGKKETITRMTRIMVTPGEEYIVYDHSWEGRNPIGSFLKVSQQNVGVYPRFEPIYERFIQEDNTYGQRLISKNTNVGYYIRFTKDKAEELHKLCNDMFARANARTAYYVVPDGGTKITVASYQDWLNGEFEDLYHNGRITKDDSNKLEKPKQR